MGEARKADAVGFNHVALEVGDIEEALAFYSRLFDFKLRGKSDTSAFLDLGDQFLALQRAIPNPPRGGILDLWSTTRMPSARRWPTRDPTAARPVSRLSRPVGQSYRDCEL
jgi:catechol 2,3-dioxygenase-like lactoylglutathione lyase family enzyme